MEQTGTCTSRKLQPQGHLISTTTKEINHTLVELSGSASHQVTQVALPQRRWPRADNMLKHNHHELAAQLTPPIPWYD